MSLLKSSIQDYFNDPTPAGLRAIEDNLTAGSVAEELLELASDGLGEDKDEDRAAQVLGLLLQHNDCNCDAVLDDSEVRTY